MQNPHVRCFAPPLPVKVSNTVATIASSFLRSYNYRDYNDGVDHYYAACGHDVCVQGYVRCVRVYGSCVQVCAFVCLVLEPHIYFGFLIHVCVTPYLQLSSSPLCGILHESGHAIGVGYVLYVFHV